MRKFNKAYNLRIISLILAVLFLCVNTACSLPEDSLRPYLGMPPSRLEESFIKEALQKARDIMKNTDIDSALEYLQEFGYAGIASGVVIKHALSGKSALLMGSSSSGRSTTVEGIIGKYQSEGWKLVANGDVIFLFADNDPKQLFVIQGPLFEKEGLITFSGENVESVLHLRFRKKIMEASKKPEHIDTVIMMAKDITCEKSELKPARLGTKLRWQTVYKAFNELHPRPPLSLEDSMVVSHVPMLYVRQPYEAVSPDRFQAMVVNIHDSVMRSWTDEDETVVIEESKGCLFPVATLSAITHVGMKSNFAPKGLHRVPISMLYTIVTTYKSIILQELGPGHGFSFHVKEISAKEKTTINNIDDLLMLELQDNDDIEIELKAEGDLPYSILAYIMENIKLAFEDRLFLIREEGLYSTISILQERFQRYKEITLKDNKKSATKNLDLLKINEIMENIKTDKNEPIYDYVLRLELLHALGILKGILLYPVMGNDYLTSYFTMSFGLNTKNGLGVTEMDTKLLENEAISLGLPKKYEGKQKNWKVFNKNSFDYDAYFPEIEKAGGVDVLFIKGLTKSLEFDKSFPGAEYFASFTGSDEKRSRELEKRLHDSIKDLIARISQDILNEGGVVIIADEQDLWLADFIAKELGFLDLLSSSKYRAVRELLSKDTSSSMTYLEQYRLIIGKVPIRIFKKKQSSFESDIASFELLFRNL